MRNQSFTSISTTNFENDLESIDGDQYDLNLSISSLAKLNRRKPHISTILKLNLIVVLIISLFIKLTVVTVINGSLSAFLGLKLVTHGLILYTFLKKHYISLQLLFVLDVILFVIFLLFEFLLLVSNFAIIIIQQKKNKNLGFIGIWLLILVAAIDLLILVMVAIVLENYRKPKERLQQLESKLITVVHNGRLFASQMCKSGSYLLGFVCNTSSVTNQQSSTSSSMLANNSLNARRSRLRTIENQNQLTNTNDTSSFSLNDDEFIHFSSIEINNPFSQRFHSFSDFYNFNNRNDPITTDSGNNFTITPSTSVNANIITTVNSNYLNKNQPTVSSFSNTINSTTNTMTTINSIYTNNLRFNNHLPINEMATTSSIPTPLMSTQIPSNPILNNLQKEKTNDNLSVNDKTNDNTENENTFVHMYQMNLDEEGEPTDGPLRCVRKTIINNTEIDSSKIVPTSSNSIVQVSSSKTSSTTKPVYI